APSAAGARPRAAPPPALRLQTRSRSRVWPLPHTPRIRRGGPRNPVGTSLMPLHASAKAFLDQRAAMGVRPVQELSVEEARAQAIRVARAAGPGDPVARTEDLPSPGPLGTMPRRPYPPVDQRSTPVPVRFRGA